MLTVSAFDNDRNLKTIGSIEPQVSQKYNLKAGQKTPFTGFLVWWMFV